MMMSDVKADDVYRELGHGILLRRDGLGEPTELIDGRVHYRFMDQLYLPSHTHELSPDSIIVINRWREAVLANTKLPHRNRVRQVAAVVIRGASPVSLLEIGPGKFPLATECGAREYVALEIDDEAREYNLSNHVRCISNVGQLIKEADRIDSVAALFVMQFRMSEEIFEVLRGVRSDAIMFVNIPSPNQELVQARVQQLEQTGATVATFDLSQVGVHDVLVVAGHHDAGSRLQQAIRTTTNEITAQWPDVEETPRTMRVDKPPQAS